MVKERDPSRTSCGQYLSPQKPNRPPLANISTKMQSSSPKTTTTGNEDDDDDFTSLKPGPQAEFGKASPLRNPLQQHSHSNLFIPRKKALHKPSPHRQFMSSAARQAQSQESPDYAQQLEPRAFYLPGQRPAPPQPVSAPQYNPANPPYKPAFHIQQPINRPTVTTHAPPKPTFSSLGTGKYQNPDAPSKAAVDLTKQDDGDDSFDPDAIIREQGQNFGEPDLYSYVATTQADENIKNLLEGAFDDKDDQNRIRLRKRAKKAFEDGNSKKAKGLADKLAALKVKDEEAGLAEPEEEEEEEDGTVDGLAVKLLPHQVEGVSWMIDKEIGRAKIKGVYPFGGILADDMGLGKTVQSVALILTNARPAPDAKPEHPKQKMPGKEVSKSTLVVAPLALIKQWEDEIKTKVSKSHALRVLVHHGPNRTKSGVELKKYDVVITTYQTLTSEHAGSQMSIVGGSRIGCMGVHWYRIMLDEAHSIKNRNAKSTQACYALESWYRWCLTGTPMQNNLDELQSLIRFLRIKPYSELPHWKQQITQPMKNGRGGLAIKRLQVFLNLIMKRRTKDILKQSGALNFGGKANTEGDDGVVKQQGMRIVKREVITVDCVFDATEKEFYNRLQNRADRRLQEMMKEKGGTDYIGALVLLLRLRQACNHSQLIEIALSKDKETVQAQMSSQRIHDKHASEADEMDDLTRLMGCVSVASKKCDVCQVQLTATESREGAVRCRECDADIIVMGRKMQSKLSKLKSKAEKTKSQRKQHVLPDDSDEEGEGEWIGKGPEQLIDLGKAGGSDDEDAEGGGETLGSIDSDRSADEDEDDEDSPPRARTRRRLVVKDEEDDEHSETNSSDTATKSSEDVDQFLHPDRYDSTEQKPSSKIRHLLRILHADSPKHKTIVFSQFTTMLDLIEPHLRSAGIHHVRYDGSMRNDAREASLHSLRNDPKTRVLLCSLKCGSLGLNLTAASRVVIVEPFWNPFVEEQAIDRVHRLNQTVDVKVYRLTVPGTVEERIIDLQERKRELAKAAIEGAGNSINKLTMKEILGLFKHDANHSGAAHDEQDREMWNKFGGQSSLLDGPSSNSVFGASSKPDIMGRSSGATGRGGRGQEHDVFGRRW
jgi:SNF2 family DNA or RNA helicase